MRWRVDPLVINRVGLLLMMVGVYCLLFPFCALVLEHHFAERQPNHMHLYLGRVTPDHVHPYEVFHTHLPADEADDASFRQTQKSDQTPDDIVYLTAHDGASQSFAQLTVPPLHLSWGFPSPDETRYSIGIPTGDTKWQDPYLALPKRPPRLLFLSLLFTYGELT